MPELRLSQQCTYSFLSNFQVGWLGWSFFMHLLWFFKIFYKLNNSKRHKSRPWNKIYENYSHGLLIQLSLENFLFGNYGSIKWLATFKSIKNHSPLSSDFQLNFHILVIVKKHLKLKLNWRYLCRWLRYFILVYFCWKNLIETFWSVSAAINFLKTLTAKRIKN